MPLRSMEQGIAAIQAGKIEEGSRLLRIALKSPGLSGELQAVALMWLAETNSDKDFKADCYKRALEVDPQNVHVRQRMAQLLSSQLPPAQPAVSDTGQFTPPPMTPVNPQTPYPPTGNTPTYGQAPVSGQRPDYSPPPLGGQNPYGQSGLTPPPQPYQQLPTYQTTPPGQQVDPNYATGGYFRTVGVVGGPNGAGTGFFVSQRGLLATSRFVVGGVENLTITLDTGRTIPGRTTRAFPELDVALVETNIAVSNLLPMSQITYVPDNTRLNAYAHNGQVMSGQRRASKSKIPPDWFPTTISKLADAGGNPVLDERNYLVGMLTRNVSRSSGYVYGLHISAIYRCVEAYTKELMEDNNRAYCTSCGNSSRAVGVGAFYCEVCGSVLPQAQHVPRFPLPQAVTFYGENMYQPCPHCGARLGFYDGRCLRCGGTLVTNPRNRSRR